jgi:class 3 adenylate cyclase
MTNIPAKDIKFRFERRRGIVWVCDLSQSSRLLNDSQSVDALEEYLPRLYWTTMQAVNAVEGTFIKWTGDGFLAWFPTTLERDLGTMVKRIFDVAWHLSLLHNVTGLGVQTVTQLRLRHGVCYEPDALVLRITERDGHGTQDLIGRAVVFACRLCSVGARFPGLTTQKQLVVAYQEAGGCSIMFRKRSFSADECLKYFKGERYGIKSVYIAEKPVKRRRALRSIVRDAKAALKSPYDTPPKEPTVPEKFFIRMFQGPEWANKAAVHLFKFMEEKFAGTLRQLLPVLEEQLRQQKMTKS